MGEDEGKLPLLEYALRETWEASRKAWQDGGKPGLLTFAAYNGLKGVGGGIGTRAEQIYQNLDEIQRQAARRLFVSLVTPGEGQEDTRARATVPDEPAMAEVVREFSDPTARLLVTGWDQSRGERLAEVSHEALIRNWGTLRSWIEANREILRTRERIRGQMKHWEQEEEPDDLLLQRGRALEEGRQLLASHGDVLIDDIRPYVNRSIEHVEAEQRKRDEAQRNELKRERELREAQEVVTKRTKLGLITASLLFLIAGGAAWYGWYQQEIAASAAVAALEERSLALAALARTEIKAGNAISGMLLALRGMPIVDVVEPTHAPTKIRKALVDAMQMWRPALTLRGDDPSEGILAAGFSPDGTRIVSGSGDGTVQVWDAASGQELKVLHGGAGSITAIAFSRDGTRVVDAYRGATWYRCGTQRAAVCCWSCAAMSTPSTPLVSRRTARGYSAAAGTAPCGCGTRRAGSSCWSCVAMRMGYMPPRSRRMARGS